MKGVCMAVQAFQSQKGIGCDPCVRQDTALELGPILLFLESSIGLVREARLLLLSAQM